jgi:hypothetical protein
MTVRSRLWQVFKHGLGVFHALRAVDIEILDLTEVSRGCSFLHKLITDHICQIIVVVFLSHGALMTFV